MGGHCRREGSVYETPKQLVLGVVALFRCWRDVQGLGGRIASPRRRERVTMAHGTSGWRWQAKVLSCSFANLISMLGVQRKTRSGHGLVDKSGGGRERIGEASEWMSTRRLYCLMTSSVLHACGCLTTGRRCMSPRRHGLGWKTSEKEIEGGMCGHGASMGGCNEGKLNLYKIAAAKREEHKDGGMGELPIIYVKESNGREG